MNFSVSTPFQPQKTVVISFLADNVSLNFFSLSGECEFILCFDCSLVSKFTNETHLCGIALKSQS
jgi:hypothetical protein